MLVKLYGQETGGQGHERKYSPSECVGARKDTITGNPDPRHVLHGAGEPYHAHVDAAVHAADKRLLKEVAKPRVHGCAVCALVQLRPHPQDATDLARDGGP